jgi:DNA-binding CsgD family transcriptional regulator
MGTQAGVAPLTAREREVARLIGLGLTNRDIARELGISDRTVGAHVQNILNKLGGSNRAQIATWSAQHSSDRISTGPKAAAQAGERPAGRLSTPARTMVLVGAGLVVSLLLSADHAPQATPDSVATYERGSPIFDAQFLIPNGEGFSPRELYGDIDASAVAYTVGSIRYSILKPGGRTGNAPDVHEMARYFAEFELSVEPGTSSTFWLNLTSNEFPTSTGEHVVAINTEFEALQMAYYTSHDNATAPIGPQASIHGLQTGRRFMVAVLVTPPRYEVFLDRMRVIDLSHDPNPLRQSPSLTIFGGTGTVRLTALRVYVIA